MNPQDREEYGMDLAIKKREEMSEEYIKIEPKEGLQGILYFKVGENYEEIDNPEVLDFLVEKNVYIYRKAEPKEEDYPWLKRNDARHTLSNERVAYLNKVLVEDWGSPDELMRKALPNLTNEEWKGLETYYMPNVGVMRKIIDRIMEIRKGEV